MIVLIYDLFKSQILSLRQNDIVIHKFNHKSSMIIAIIIILTKLFFPLPNSGTVGPHDGGGPRGGAALGGPAAAVNQPGAAVGGDRDAGAAVAEQTEERAGRASG